jgi:hypothetical protein
MTEILDHTDYKGEYLRLRARIERLEKAWRNDERLWLYADRLRELLKADPSAKEGT